MPASTPGHAHPLQTMTALPAYRQSSHGHRTLAISWPRFQSSHWGRLACLVSPRIRSMLGAVGREPTRPMMAPPNPTTARAQTTSLRRAARKAEAAGKCAADR